MVNLQELADNNAGLQFFTKKQNMFKNNMTKSFETLKL